MEHIPAELLLRIFRYAVGEYHRLAAGYMCISKYWSSQAKQVLYEEVDLDSLERLELFKKHILRDCSGDVRTSPVGHLVLSLSAHATLYGPESDDLSTELMITNALTTILLHLPNLRTFEDYTDTTHSKLAHMTIISRLSHTICTRLGMHVGRDDEGVFELINTFVMLKYLDISVSERTAEWTHDPLHALRRPSLKGFDWQVHGLVTTSMVQFLSACEVGPDCGVTLWMPELQKEDTELLIPFFKHNIVNELTLRYIQMDVQELLAPHLPYIQHVQIWDVAPAVEFARRALPEYLNLDYMKTLELGQAEFWDFLRALQEAKPATRCIIRIYHGEELFSWSGGDHDDDCATFIGRLLPIASRLFKEKIVVLDRYELDYTLSYFKI